MSKLQSIVKDITEDIRTKPDRGEVASSIPELARVDPNAFGLVVVAADGTIAAGGDSDTPFSIPSISKVFTLALALGKVGDRLWRRVGREPSGNEIHPGPKTTKPLNGCYVSSLAAGSTSLTALISANALPFALLISQSGSNRPTRTSR